MRKLLIPIGLGITAAGFIKSKAPTKYTVYSAVAGAASILFACVTSDEEGKVLESIVKK